MYYALGTVQHLHASPVVILAILIAVMVFWRQITKAVIALLVAAMIIGLATTMLMLLQHG